MSTHRETRAGETRTRSDKRRSYEPVEDLRVFKTRTCGFIGLFYITHPGSDRTGCRMTCGALLGGASGATSGHNEVSVHGGCGISAAFRITVLHISFSMQLICIKTC